MDVYEALEKRRTIRKFKNPATEEQLQRIILEGVKAPSASNRQPWEFVIIDDPGLIEKVGQAKYDLNIAKAGMQAGAQAQKESFNNASLILIYYKEGEANAASAWACIENMSIAAAAEGLGSRIAGFFGPDAQNAVGKLVNAPDGMTLATGLSIGVPAEEPGPRTLRPEGSWLHRNKF